MRYRPRSACGSPPPATAHLVQTYPLNADGTPHYNSDGTLSYDYGKYPYNDGYACVPFNHYNFVGWDNLFAAFNAIFAQMNADGVQLDALDLEGEAQPASGQTATLLNIFDPDTSAGYGNLLGLNCPNIIRTVPSRGIDVLGSLQCIATNNHLDPGGIGMSFTDDQTDAAPQAGQPANDCPNVYGDPARVDEPSTFIHAMMFQSFGDFTDLANNYQPRTGTTPGYPYPGLDCSVGAHLPPAPDMLLPVMPVSYTAFPEVIDMHAYITLQAPGLGGGELPADLSAQQTDKVAGDTWTEAIATFSDLKKLLDLYYGATGQTGRLIIGETHSPTATSWPTAAPQTCEGGASIEARPMFAGLRQSEANLVNRDGSPLAPNYSYSYLGITIRPFWGAGGFLASCMGFPAQLTEFGYDMSQPLQ